MKPVAIAYFKPTTLEEALSLLAEHGQTGKIISGGQSLVPSMNFRLARPDTLIDIGGIAGLRGVTDRGDHLEIGATTTHATFHAPVCDGPLGQLLTKVVQNIAHYPIRQRGTFGGSLSHADPASEWCLVAATFDAELEIHGQQGARRVPVADFFRGAFVTAVGEEEVLARIRLPKLSADWGTGFIEFSRRKGDFALASAIAALKVAGGKISGAHLGVGSVGSHGQRLPELEAQIIGQPATAGTLAQVAEGVRALISPSTDIHGSAEYRSDLAVTMLRRAMTQALDEVMAEELA